MMIAGVAWLLAGAVAGLVSESAAQLPSLRRAREIGISDFLNRLLHGLRKALHAPTHAEFAAHYFAVVGFSFRWLKAQLRLMVAHILVGGGVYSIACALLIVTTGEYWGVLGPFGADLLFLVGAAVTYFGCRWSRLHQPQVQL